MCIGFLVPRIYPAQANDYNLKIGIFKNKYKYSPYPYSIEPSTSILQVDIKTNGDFCQCPRFYNNTQPTDITEPL